MNRGLVLPGGREIAIEQGHHPATIAGARVNQASKAASDASEQNHRRKNNAAVYH